MISHNQLTAEVSARDTTGRLLALWTVLCIAAGILLGALWMQVQEQPAPIPERVYQLQGDWVTVNALHLERDQLRMKLDEMMGSYWSVPWRCQ